MNWQQILQLLNSSTSPGWPSPIPTSGFDLGGLLGSIGSTFGPKAGNTLTTLGNVAQPLLGAGLLGAGLAQKEEPGYANEAISYLRNRLAPQGIAQQFSGQIGALAQEYKPLQEQQRNQLLDQTQQRFIAGQPSSFSTAMSGPEIAAIRNAIVNQILPAERAERARIGEYLLTTGGSAAGDLLKYAKPDPLGTYVASLGMNLLGGRGGQAGQTGTTGAATNPIQQAMQSLMPGTSLGGGLTSLGGGLIGDASGKLIGSMQRDGTIIGLDGQVIQNAATTGSLLSKLFPALQFAGGTALALNAPNIGQNQFQSTLTGAGGGALAGSVFGPIGTASGAITGGLFGLFGERSQQQQEKAYNLSQDLDSQVDQFNEIKNIGLEFAQQFGIDSSAFAAYANQLAPQISGPGDEQGMLATALGQMLRSQLWDAMFIQVAPQLKQRMIEYLTRSTFSAPNSSYFGSAHLNMIGTWSQAA